jgi:hypothetical protein
MANLERTPGYKRLQPGDSWTFVGLSKEQMRVANELGVGRTTSRWFATDESGRIFRIVRIHDTLHSVETVFEGFEMLAVKEGDAPQ